MTVLSNVYNFSAERLYRQAGDVFVYEGDYDYALLLVDQMLLLDPDNAKALVLKADILFCTRQDQRALQYLEKALALDPTRAEAYLSKAGVLDALGKPAKALQNCQKAFALVHSGNQYLLPSLFDQTVVLLLGLKKYRQAQRLLEQARVALPEEAYVGLCATYQSAIRVGCQTRRQRTRRAGTLRLAVL